MTAGSKNHSCFVLLGGHARDHKEYVLWNMREVNTAGLNLVFRGKVWELEADPCSKNMISYLERNEKLVTWFQPEGKGPESQIAAIQVGDSFCHLSVRMMKAIWR